MASLTIVLWRTVIIRANLSQSLLKGDWFSFLIQVTLCGAEIVNNTANQQRQQQQQQQQQHNRNDGFTGIDSNKPIPPRPLGLEENTHARQ
jgi:hypothetical protein